MRHIPYLWLDVFAHQPFAGNGLCVILDATSLSDAELQAIARETNLSETTFVLPPTRPEATYRVRIFTPGGELPFAGHPTLGTAAALVLSEKAAAGRLLQETISGLTEVNVDADLVVMQPPQPRFVDAPDSARIAQAVGLPVVHAELIESGVKHLVIQVPALEPLAQAAPDTAALRALSQELGCLGAFLHRHGLLPPSGAFWYEQGIEMGRPSRLWVEARAGAGGLTVRVGGQVAQVSRGEFLLP